VNNNQWGVLSKMLPMGESIRRNSYEANYWVDGRTFIV